MTTLRPCPFCGGKAEVVNLFHAGCVATINVECESCSTVLFGDLENREQMIAKWNTRVGTMYRVNGRVGRLVRIENGQALLDLGNGVECFIPVEDLEVME